MRVGVFARTFPGTDPGAVLTAAAAAGFDGVQWNWTCAGLGPLPTAIPPEVAASVADGAVAAGVRVEAVSATWNMIHPDPAVRAGGLAALDAIAASATAIGTRLVTLCTGTRDPDDQWRWHPDNGSPDAWRELRREMTAALNVADRHDVLLCIEPEHANVVASAGAARRLLDELDHDRLRIVLDPANLADGSGPGQVERAIDEAVDLLGDRITMAHAKDRTADGRFVAPGQGVIDFRGFVAALRRAGFDGPLVAHGFDLGDAASTARHLRAIV